MKKKPLYGSLLLLALSALLFATGADLLGAAGEGWTTREQDVRVYHLVGTTYYLAEAIQPFGAWLMWRATPVMRSIFPRVLLWLGVLIVADVILFAGALFFTGALNHRIQ